MARFGTGALSIVLAEIGYCHGRHCPGRDWVLPFNDSFDIPSNMPGILPQRRLTSASLPECEARDLGEVRHSCPFEHTGNSSSKRHWHSVDHRGLLPQRSSASAFVRTCRPSAVRHWQLKHARRTSLQGFAVTSRRTCEGTVLAMVRHRRSLEHARRPSLQRFRTGIPSSAPDTRPSRGSALTSPSSGRRSALASLRTMHSASHRFTTGIPSNMRGTQSGRGSALPALRACEALGLAEVQQRNPS